MTPLGIGFAITGVLWGLASDRIAARWPAHDDGSVRAIDWRTPLVPVFGAVALGLLPGRFDEPATLALFTVYLTVLVLLFATDLDQRLLPDLLTLPLVPLAAAGVLLGLDPFVPPEPEPILWAVVAALAFPAILYVVSLPFGSGAVGLGDLKLLLSVGLLLGPYWTFMALFVGLVAQAVVILGLLATGRIGRRSYLPMGPFLIIGIAWAILTATV